MRGKEIRVATVAGILLTGVLHRHAFAEVISKISNVSKERRDINADVTVLERTREIRNMKVFIPETDLDVRALQLLGIVARHQKRLANRGD